MGLRNISLSFRLSLNSKQFTFSNYQAASHFIFIYLYFLFLQPVETPLKEELWYHGEISRIDAENMVQEDGDYLVRESSRKPGQFVLTSKWSTYRHFIIQKDDTVREKKNKIMLFECVLESLYELSSVNYLKVDR